MADVGEGKYCDEQQLALGERLREAACIGDLDTVKFLMENGHVMDVNSKNSVGREEEVEVHGRRRVCDKYRWCGVERSMGGAEVGEILMEREWDDVVHLLKHKHNKTALHWACRRGHLTVVEYLILHGADKGVHNHKGQTPLQVASETAVIERMGGVHSNCTVEKELPIVPSYLQNPVFPFSSQLPRDMNVGLNHDPCSSSAFPVELEGQRRSDGQHPMTVSALATDTTACHAVAQPTCLLVKVRCADCEEKDFIEVDIPERSYQALLQTCCSELEVRPEAVSKIRKLPNVVIRKDKDIERLHHGQELEIVMKLYA